MGFDYLNTKEAQPSIAPRVIHTPTEITHPDGLKVDFVDESDVELFLLLAEADDYDPAPHTVVGTFAMTQVMQHPDKILNIGHLPQPPITQPNTRIPTIKPKIKTTKKPLRVRGNKSDNRTKTLYDEDSIGQYLKEIGSVPLLTAEEERTLAKTIEKGLEASERNKVDTELSIEDKTAIKLGDEAKDRFIRANLRLVVSIAKRYPTPQGIETLDLIQEGNLGLEHAVDKFNWRRGFKFSTYATFWIRQAIGRALDQKGSLIRIPGDKSAGLRAALRVNSRDGQVLNKTNTELEKLTTPVSLDKTVGDDGDATLGDLMATTMLGPEDVVMNNENHKIINELLSILDPRLRYAVEARFGLITGERQTFNEIGNYLGVTQEAARRMVLRAVLSLGDKAKKLSLEYDD